MKSGSGSLPPSPRPAPAVENRASSAWTELHRLKLLSVVLPIVFVVGMEVGVGRLVSSGLLEHRFQLAVELFVTVLAITTFGLVMFRFIDRAQRQVLRQNRDLAATNAVSSAVRGEVGVDRIIEVALESVISSTGASEVSVTVFPPESSPLDNETHHRRTAAGSTPAMPDDPRNDAVGVVEIPLSMGTRFVGRMRLHLPADAREHDGLGSGTLQVIGQQLANAIQLAQLVADLERTNHEGDVFHDVLLQISNQSAPADILESVVQHARDLPGTDDAVLCLNEDAARSVRLEGSATLCGGAAFTTRGHFPASAATKAMNSCGVALRACQPSLFSMAWTSGELTASSAAALSFATRSGGVPAGARNPVQSLGLMVICGSPASAMVGTSGKVGSRIAPVDA